MIKNAILNSKWRTFDDTAQFAELIGKFLDSLLKVYYFQEPQANDTNLILKTCLRAIIWEGNCWGEGEEGCVI